MRSAAKGISLVFTNLWSSFRQWIKGLSQETDDVSFVFHRFLYLAYHHLLYIPISAVIESLYTIVNSDTVPLGDTHVSTFYSSPGSNLHDKVIITFVLPLTGVFFGGLHCIGWNFVFPTHIEKILWRVMSLLITCIPAVSIFTFCMYRVGIGLESTRIQKVISWNCPRLCVCVCTAVPPCSGSEFVKAATGECIPSRRLVQVSAPYIVVNSHC